MALLVGVVVDAADASKVLLVAFLIKVDDVAEFSPAIRR
jgi:hypothetical protein